jgi:alkylated DNA repair dioxygenase AlkB
MLLIVMDFMKDTKISCLLEPRSLIVLKDDARYLWAHSIAAREKKTNIMVDGLIESDEYL